MKQNPGLHGRSSQKQPGTPAMADSWRMAGELAVSHPGAGEWVPKGSIWVREDINPRDHARVDQDRVNEYAAVFYDLPPITVQRDTFALIDGNHRLHAAYDGMAMAECIRIVEVDVADEDLREAAFRANAEHGLALTPKERIAHLRYLIAKYGHGWSLTQYARAAGVSKSAVQDHREPVRESTPTDQVYSKNIPDTVQGVDGKRYPVRETAERSSRTVRTFDPGPEQEYDEDSYDEGDEDEGTLVSTLVAERTLVDGTKINILTGEITPAPSAGDQLDDDARAFCQALSILMAIQSPMQEIWFSLDDRARRGVAESIATCEKRLVEMWRLCPVAGP